jgi:DNA-binding NarL/FixJ family response regulator
MMKIRLLLVDDHAVVRTGLRMLLEGEEDFEIAGEADSGSSALIQVSQIKPDVV